MVQDKERGLLIQFEKLDERVRRNITDYQAGLKSIRELAASVGESHDNICSIVGESPFFFKRVMELEHAYKELLKGGPLAYHGALFRLHHDWVSYISGAGIEIGNSYIAGWAKSADIPKEIVEFTKETQRINALAPRLPTYLRMTVFVVKQPRGWRTYVGVGTQCVHYSYVGKEDDCTKVVVSDYLKDRGEAVSNVLRSLECFSIDSASSIILDEKDDIRGKNFMIALKKKGAVDMRQMARIFFFGSIAYDSFWKEVQTRNGVANAPPDEGSEMYIRSRALQEEVLKWYVRKGVCSVSLQAVLGKIYIKEGRAVPNPIVEKLKKVDHVDFIPTLKRYLDVCGKIKTTEKICRFLISE
jgi:hypothetical protein